MENDITQLVQKAIQLLQEYDLKECTLKSYERRAFQPILDHYQTCCINKFQKPLMDKLEMIYQEQFEGGLI